MVNKPKSAELIPGPGFRVLETIERPSRELCRRLAEFETPDVSDMLNRMYTMSEEIKNVVNDKPLCGPALTIKVFPGDNLMVHKALDFIQEGDILVVDTSGTPRNAVVGDLVANKAKHLGAAGFVIDGLIRDIDGVQEVGLPMYARGVTPFGPLHRGPGELNFPVSCGGVVVNPGDLIVADRNGVVAVRKDFAEDVIGRLEAHKSRMNEYVENIKKGIFSNAWVNDQLESDNCQRIK